MREVEELMRVIYFENDVDKFIDSRPCLRSAHAGSATYTESSVSSSAPPIADVELVTHRRHFISAEDDHAQAAAAISRPQGAISR